MEQVASLVYLPFPTAFHTLLRLHTHFQTQKRN